MSSPPHRAARHSSGRVRRLPDLRAIGVASARCGAKGVVGLGLVAGAGAGVVALAAESPADAAGDPQALDVDTSTATATATRELRPVTARASDRTALETPDTVTAPRWQAGVASTDFGAIDVRAVAKPAPKPTPTQGSTTTPSAAPTPEVPTNAYAAEAQALGLGPNAQLVYAAVRTNFPSITDIGGYRAGDPGDHGTGHAVDIMCDTATGDQVAAYMQAHASELHVKYVIWKQRIWFPGTGEWRWMEDRGSVTANHYDHVHVSVY